MLSLLVKIIPLDLAATLSPGILALILIVLSSKNHPKAHAISFFIGSLLVGLGIAILGFTLGNNFSDQAKPNLISATIDLILGLVMVIYGLKIILAKERKITLGEGEQPLKILKWLGLGFVISITNFDALFLSFTAAKEVGSADIDVWTKFILLIVNIFFFTLPITLPILFKMLLPKIAEPILAKIDRFVMRYGKYLIFGMFLIFGIMLIFRGLKYFF